ncbi:YheE family protein [Rossellomorea aquimaris]|uniref:YheE family protein n=1 Tax=Rossellomorea aquimaris TaxID=189382 RepID=UPI0005CB639E|nr:YheE family protein [Rossellomorea aquimaris]
MIQHFQYKNMFENKQLPGWTFSFYFSGLKYQGNYHKDGRVEWTGPTPPVEKEEILIKQVHELMLFHVYD